MRYEDSMKGVADQIIKEQQRVSKIINNPEEFHWHDEYATLNFFRFICKNIGNLRNGEIEKMVTHLSANFIFHQYTEHLIIIKCPNSWMNLIGQYCVSRT